MWINGKNMVLKLLLFSLVGCGGAKMQVTGMVKRVMGNQMPSPDLINEEPGGFSTTVYFFAPTLMKMGTPTGEQGVFLMTDKKLVSKSLAKKDGSFKLKLNPGKYSVLLGKDGKFYSNISSLEGLINPIEINKSSKKPIVLKADWGAVY